MFYSNRVLGRNFLLHLYTVGLHAVLTWPCLDLRAAQKACSLLKIHHFSLRSVSHYVYQSNFACYILKERTNNKTYINSHYLRTGRFFIKLTWPGTFVVPCWWLCVKGEVGNCINLWFPSFRCQVNTSTLLH